MVLLQVEWKADGQLAQLVECVDWKASRKVVQDLRRAGITAAITYRFLSKTHNKTFRHC